MGPNSTARLKLVHPGLSRRIYVLESQMSVPIGIVQGFRKADEQLALWAQGRMSLDQVNVLRVGVGWSALLDADNKETVTKARPGYSWHEFGLAVDAVPEDAITFAPDWNDSHPVWKEMIEKGKAQGLTSGQSFQDMPHFQLPGRFPVTPDDEVREIYHTGGLQAVWQASGIAA